MTVASAALEPSADGAPDIAIRADARGVILSVSATCSVLGYEPQELVGVLGTDLVHPEDRARFIENTASLFEPGAAAAGRVRIHRFRCKDGSWVWLRGHPTMLATPKDGRGELVNFFELISEQDARVALAG